MGGTNPSLLEALGSTKLNLLLDVGFNREVAENSALYWSKEPGSLAALLDTCDKLPEDRIAELGMHTKKGFRTIIPGNILQTNMNLPLQISFRIMLHFLLFKGIALYYLTIP